MTGKPFTAQQVLDAMEEIVIEAGYDYVYEKVMRHSPVTGSILPLCVYADNDDAPSCLIGRVIHKLDPEAFKQLSCKEKTHGSHQAYLLDSRGYLPEGFWDREAADVAGLAQEAQDQGATWGDALARAQDFGAEID